MMRGDPNTVDPRRHSPSRTDLNGKADGFFSEQFNKNQLDYKYNNINSKNMEGLYNTMDLRNCDDIGLIDIDSTQYNRSKAIESHHSGLDGMLECHEEPIDLVGSLIDLTSYDSYEQRQQSGLQLQRQLDQNRNRESAPMINISSGQSLTELSTTTSTIAAFSPQYEHRSSASQKRDALLLEQRSLATTTKTIFVDERSVIANNFHTIKTEGEYGTSVENRNHTSNHSVAPQSVSGYSTSTSTAVYSPPPPPSVLPPTSRGRQLHLASSFQSNTGHSTATNTAVYTPSPSRLNLAPAHTTASQQRDASILEQRSTRTRTATIVLDDGIESHRCYSSSEDAEDTYPFEEDVATYGRSPNIPYLKKSLLPHSKDGHGILSPRQIEIVNLKDAEDEVSEQSAILQEHVKSTAKAYGVNESRSGRPSTAMYDYHVENPRSKQPTTIEQNFSNQSSVGAVVMKPTRKTMKVYHNKRAAAKSGGSNGANQNRRIDESGLAKSSKMDYVLPKRASTSPDIPKLTKDQQNRKKRLKELKERDAILLQRINSLASMAATNALVAAKPYKNNINHDQFNEGMSKINEQTKSNTFDERKYDVQTNKDSPGPLLSSSHLSLNANGFDEKTVITKVESENEIIFVEDPSVEHHSWSHEKIRSYESRDVALQDVDDSPHVRSEHHKERYGARPTPEASLLVYGKISDKEEKSGYVMIDDMSKDFSKIQRNRSRSYSPPRQPTENTRRSGSTRRGDSSREKSIVVLEDAGTVMAEEDRKTKNSIDYEAGSSDAWKLKGTESDPLEIISVSSSLVELKYRTDSFKSKEPIVLLHRLQENEEEINFVEHSDIGNQRQQNRDKTKIDREAMESELAQNVEERVDDSKVVKEINTSDITSTIAKVVTASYIPNDSEEIKPLSEKNLEFTTNDKEKFTPSFNQVLKASPSGLSPSHRSVSEFIVRRNDIHTLSPKHLERGRDFVFTISPVAEKVKEKQSSEERIRKPPEDPPVAQKMFSFDRESNISPVASLVHKNDGLDSLLNAIVAKHDKTMSPNEKSVVAASTGNVVVGSNNTEADVAVDAAVISAITAAVAVEESETYETYAPAMENKERSQKNEPDKLVLGDDATKGDVVELTNKPVDASNPGSLHELALFRHQQTEALIAQAAADLQRRQNKATSWRQSGRKPTSVESQQDVPRTPNSAKQEDVPNIPKAATSPVNKAEVQSNLVNASIDPISNSIDSKMPVESEIVTLADVQSENVEDKNEVGSPNETESSQENINSQANDNESKVLPSTEEEKRSVAGLAGDETIPQTKKLTNEGLDSCVVPNDAIQEADRQQDFEQDNVSSTHKNFVDENEDSKQSNKTRPSSPQKGKLSTVKEKRTKRNVSSKTNKDREGVSGEAFESKVASSGKASKKKGKKKAKASESRHSYKQIRSNDSQYSAYNKLSSSGSENNEYATDNSETKMSIVDTLTTESDLEMEREVYGTCSVPYAFQLLDKTCAWLENENTICGYKTKPSLYTKVKEGENERRKHSNGNDILNGTHLCVRKPNRQVISPTRFGNKASGGGNQPPESSRGGHSQKDKKCSPYVRPRRQKIAAKQDSKTEEPQQTKPTQLTRTNNAFENSLISTVSSRASIQSNTARKYLIERENEDDQDEKHNTKSILDTDSDIEECVVEQTTGNVSHTSGTQPTTDDALRILPQTPSLDKVFSPKSDSSVNFDKEVFSAARDAGATTMEKQQRQHKVLSNVNKRVQSGKKQPLTVNTTGNDNDGYLIDSDDSSRISPPASVTTIIEDEVETTKSPKSSSFQQHQQQHRSDLPIANSLSPVQSPTFAKEEAVATSSNDINNNSNDVVTGLDDDDVEDRNDDVSKNRHIHTDFIQQRRRIEHRDDDEDRDVMTHSNNNNERTVMTNVVARTKGGMTPSPPPPPPPPPPPIVIDCSNDEHKWNEQKEQPRQKDTPSQSNNILVEHHRSAPLSPAATLSPMSTAKFTSHRLLSPVADATVVGNDATTVDEDREDMKQQQQKQQQQQQQQQQENNNNSYKALNLPYAPKVTGGMMDYDSLEGYHAATTNKQRSASLLQAEEERMTALELAEKLRRRAASLKHRRKFRGKNHTINNPNNTVESGTDRLSPSCFSSYSAASSCSVETPVLPGSSSWTIRRRSEGRNGTPIDP